MKNLCVFKSKAAELCFAKNVLLPRPHTHAHTLLQGEGEDSSGRGCLISTSDLYLIFVLHLNFLALANPLGKHTWQSFGAY